MVEASTYDETVADYLRGVMDRLIDPVAARFEKQQQAGRALPLAPRAGASVLVGMVLQALYAQVGRDSGIGDEELVETLATVWLRAVYGHRSGQAGWVPIAGQEQRTSLKAPGTDWVVQGAKLAIETDSDTRTGVATRGSERLGDQVSDACSGRRAEAAVRPFLGGSTDQAFSRRSVGVRGSVPLHNSLAARPSRLVGVSALGYLGEITGTRRPDCQQTTPT
jgi:Transcriptional regulator EthR, C-terminal domain